MMRADKREEDALRQVNERLEQAIDSISDAFVWYDADGKLVLCNQNHRDFFPHLGDIYHPGISREEIFRHHAEAMFEKDPTFKVEDYLSERRKLTHTPRPDREAQLFDGRWVAIRERPVAGGGMVSIRTDITDRKKTQDTIAGLLKQNELILASTGDGIFGLDLEGRTTFANAAMARMTGWGAEELIGKFLHDIFRHTRPDGNPCPREECSICIAHNDSKAYRVNEEVFWRKNGTSFPAEYVSTPIEEDGEIVGAVVAARDITSRKKAEKELIRHRDHLQELVDAATADLNFKARELKRALEKEQELNELQRRFVAMASHELRTPLAIIDSSAQRLKRRLDNNELTAENVDKRVGKIRGAVQRMIRLIESTMSVARMDEGKLEVNFGPCNVAEVLKAACSSQQEISENHIISCELLDLPETIPADRRALEQVLANLLSNAVKYAAHAPVIDVTAFSAVSDVIISVQDYGIGIDADDLNRIGERFFRAKTSAGIEGTGIGLNLVKTLVEMHDGTLKVESERDKGSKFIIRIPITRQLRQEPTEKGQARLF